MDMNLLENLAFMPLCESRINYRVMDRMPEEKSIAAESDLINKREKTIMASGN